MTTVIVPGPVEFTRGAGGLSGVAISVHALTVAAGPWPVDVEAATWTWYSTQAVSSHSTALRTSAFTVSSPEPTSDEYLTYT